MKTLYFGGPILTMKDDQKKAEAILIDDDKIIAVGEKADLLEKHDNVEEVDLQGQTPMPAFIDPHSHVSMMAQTALMADLEEAESFDDVIQILTDYKKKIT